MTTKLTPAETREVFGTNLRKLIARYPSVSEVSRALGINRAQFNRYLSGESHPRPDTLMQICGFFGMDARILVTPLEEPQKPLTDPLSHPEIRNYTLAAQTPVDEHMFPSGFYRVSRQSFLYPDRYVVNLLYVYRKDGLSFLKGFEPRRSVAEQGLPVDASTRQFRGYVFRTDDGISAVTARLGAITVTFNCFFPTASLNGNFWQGYAVRTAPETHDATRASRVALEYLGRNTAQVLKTAREGGICTVDELQPFHRKLLQPGEPFR